MLELAIFVCMIVMLSIISFLCFSMSIELIKDDGVLFGIFLSTCGVFCLLMIIVLISIPLIGW